MLINVKNANNCWHWNIYEYGQFSTHLSWALEKLYYLYSSVINLFYKGDPGVRTSMPKKTQVRIQGE